MEFGGEAACEDYLVSLEEIPPFAGKPRKLLGERSEPTFTGGEAAKF